MSGHISRRLLVAYLAGAVGEPAAVRAITRARHELNLPAAFVTFDQALGICDDCRSSAMVVASPVRLFTVVSNGVATPKPYYVGSSSSNRVNGRVSLMDLSLSGGVKGELTFWVKNLLNHVDAAHIFGAGNALNATTPRPQTAIYLQPPRTLGGEFRIHF